MSTMAASKGTGRNVSHGISKGIGQDTMNPMLQVHRGGSNMVYTYKIVIACTYEIVVVVIVYTYERG